MIKFPKIKEYRQVISTVKRRTGFRGLDDAGEPIYNKYEKLPILKFKGTVKLHGANASVVRHPDGRLETQSRNKVITPDDDLNGFSKFVFASSDSWNSVFDKIETLYQISDKTIIIYGEWCGKGIQKGVGISQLEKMYVIFAVRVKDQDHASWLYPEFTNEELGDRVYSFNNFKSYEVDIDFNNPGLYQNSLVELTLEVEEECPVAKSMGVEGIGEGIVWRCVDPNFTSSDFWFKTKGKKHSATKVKVLSPVNIEKLNSINEYVDYVCTESRLLQGIEFLKEFNKDLSVRSTGDFLRWFINDVMSEEKDTLTENNLTSSDVNKHISNKARNWYFSYLDSITFEK